MIALRYVCGFLLQTLPYAFFCCYPFWERFKINKNHAVLIAAVFLAVAAVPFTIVGAGGFGGERNEFYTNVIFYTTLLLFFIYYLLVIRAAPAQKIFVFFIMMSYGFFLTELVSTITNSFDLRPDEYMYSPVALLLYFVINLLAAKPILMLMNLVRRAAKSAVERRIWRILCVVPVAFMLLTNAIYFLETLCIEWYLLLQIYTIVMMVYIFFIYTLIFLVMERVRKQTEARETAEMMLENYRRTAENNDRIREIHHEVRHHLGVLSTYLKQKDYADAEAYLQKVSDNADKYLITSYTPNPLVNSILTAFKSRAEENDIQVNYSILVSERLEMDDLDLCYLLTNMLENAVEGCKRVRQADRYLTLKLHAKGYFLYFYCENACDTASLKTSSEKFISNKPDSEEHGYGLRLMKQVAEKYNGILNVRAQDGSFTVTTNLCLNSVN